MLKTEPRTALLVLLVVFYLAAGVLHFTAADAFMSIMPAFVPFPRAIVLATGVWEIMGAIALIFARTRRAAGVAMAVYAVVVFPANIQHAYDMIAVRGLGESWLYHGPRLFLQPLIVWWALYASGATRWPFGAQRRRKIDSP
ncbi:MAG: DoxX family protein [Parvularculaceae bacterium]|nr:DoxX family protein [Parvularculaceae bacterium]